jgi:hypothetical protein
LRDVEGSRQRPVEASTRRSHEASEIRDAIFPGMLT